MVVPSPSSPRRPKIEARPARGRECECVCRCGCGCGCPGSIEVVMMKPFLLYAHCALPNVKDPITSFVFKREENELRILWFLWGFGFFTDYQTIFHSSPLRRRSNVNDQTKEPGECVILGSLSWPGKIGKKKGCWSPSFGPRTVNIKN